MAFSANCFEFVVQALFDEHGTPTYPTPTLAPCLGGPVACLGGAVANANISVESVESVYGVFNYSVESVN